MMRKHFLIPSIFLLCLSNSLIADSPKPLNTSISDYFSSVSIGGFWMPEFSKIGESSNAWVDVSTSHAFGCGLRKKITERFFDQSWWIGAFGYADLVSGDWLQKYMSERQAEVSMPLSIGFELHGSRWGQHTLGFYSARGKNSIGGFEPFWAKRQYSMSPAIGLSGKSIIDLTNHSSSVFYRIKPFVHWGLSWINFTSDKTTSLSYWGIGAKIPLLSFVDFELLYVNNKYHKPIQYGVYFRLPRIDKQTSSFNNQYNRPPEQMKQPYYVYHTGYRGRTQFVAEKPSETQHDDFNQLNPEHPWDVAPNEIEVDPEYNQDQRMQPETTSVIPHPLPSSF